MARDNPPFQHARLTTAVGAAYTGSLGELVVETDKAKRPLWHNAVTVGGRPLASAFKRYNVRDFGATGDGATDDVVALQACFAEANGKQAEIYIPAGYYKCSDKLSLSGGNITIRGDGMMNSVIFFTASHGIEYITTNKFQDQLEVCDFGMVTLADSTYKAIQAYFASGSNSGNVGSPWSNFRANRMLLSGATSIADWSINNDSQGGSQNWSRCIDLKNAQCGWIGDCLMRAGLADVAAGSGGIGVYVGGFSTDLVISGCHMLNMDSAIEKNGPAEGLYVHNCYGVNVDYFVRLNPTARGLTVLTSSMTGTFVEGSTITGGSSLSHGVFISQQESDATHTLLTLDSPNADFSIGEILTGSSAGSPHATTTSQLTATGLSCNITASHSAYYTTAVDVRNTQQILVQGNLFYFIGNGTGRDLYLLNSYYTRFLDNLCLLNGGGTGHGAVIQGFCDDSVVAGNTFRSRTNGVELDASVNRCRVTDNNMEADVTTPFTDAGSNNIYNNPNLMGIMLTAVGVDTPIPDDGNPHPVLFDTVQYNTFGFAVTAPPMGYIEMPPHIKGFVKVTGQIAIALDASCTQVQVRIRKNGTDAYPGGARVDPPLPAGGGTFYFQVESPWIPVTTAGLAGFTDTLQLMVFQDSAGIDATVLHATNSNATWLAVEFKGGHA